MTIGILTKRCSMCKQELGIEHFHRNQAKKDGFASLCKPCQSICSKKHYESHKTEYFARNQQTRRRLRMKVLEIKQNQPCTDCGQKFHPYIMEFDHLDPDNKKYSIGRQGQRTNKQLAEELAKCELVCANCHKMRTFRRHQKRPTHILHGVE